MKFSNHLVRAKRFNLTLSPYQTAEGSTFIRISRGALQIADIPEREIPRWMATTFATKAHRPERTSPSELPGCDID